MTSRTLPIRVDAETLKGDLAIIQTGEWQPHYNSSDYGGHWRGVALRSISGSIEDLRAHAEAAGAFSDTPLLERLPAFARALALFQCPLKSVRLLSLAPHSLVREHSDPGFGLAEGDVRIHVPVQTNPLAEFYLEGERLRLDEGRAYYIDASRPHRARNRGAEDRIHLIVDAEANKWLEHVLEAGEPIERVPSSAKSFQVFRGRVFSVPALQRDLHAVSSQAELQHRATRVGRQLGFDFDEDDVIAETSPLEEPPGDGWVPARVRFRESKPFAEWIYMARRRLSEPFFDTSVRMSLRNPFARTFRCESPLGEPDEAVPPAGFVFHVSRCGSTLVAQAFAALSSTVVVSEAAPIDDVIQASHLQSGVDPQKQIRWLRSIVALLGKPRSGESRYVVKLDAWHIHRLPLLRAAFPQTPWIFLYRHPVEVLASQWRRPGQLALPGAMNPAILGLHTRDITRLAREEWLERVIAGFFQSALRYATDPKGLLVNYTQLPEALWTVISRHFSIALSGEEITQMRRAAASDSKRPGVGFETDSKAKRSEAAPVLRDPAGGIVGPLYLELERLRCSAQG